jgi:hypothetical protein
MMYAPIARILIRYGVGIVLGADAASIMAGDPDLVSVLAVVIGAATEAVYAYAKKKGWAT